jgi:uncharacterized membrane protein
MSAGNAPASRARRWLVPGLLILATLLGFLSIMARWADQQALDTNEWTDTSTKLLENEEIRNTLSAYLVDQLYSNVDVAAELRQRLPPELRPLAGPAAGGLRDVSDRVARRALASPKVQTLWEEANRATHQQFIDVVEDKGNTDVTTAGGNVTIDLQALLREVATRVGLGAKLVDKLPPDSAQLTVLKSDQLGAVQTSADLLNKGAIAITILALLLFALAVFLARDRRREALRGVSIGFIFAGLLALVVRAIAGGAVVDELAKTAAIEPAAQDIWNIGTSLLSETSWAAIINGVLIMLVVLLAGPSRGARAIRRETAPYMRDRPGLTYAAVSAVFLLLVWWGPTPAFRNAWFLLVIAALLILGTEALRRQTEREFPDAKRLG